MLTIIVPEQIDLWDDKKEEFFTIPEQKLQLEHSLISLSKWESNWKTPFLRNDHTYEECIDYIRCMTINSNVNPLIYDHLPPEIISKIFEYVEDSRTATWFTDIGEQKSPFNSSSEITSELIYYWMVALQIPVEFEKWHINRLITLIRICNEKNAPPKKMNKNQILKNYRELNAARKAKYHTKG